MTKIEATYRLRIHERGTTDPDDSTVDFTLDASVLGRDLPSIPGPVARPLDGRTETQAWSLTVVDRNDVLTSRLADGGRMHLLGRLAEYQESRDGGATWETLYTGRIAGLTETSHGRYEVRLADERWIERRARVFTETDTTSIWPVGIRYVWRGGLNVLARSQMPIVQVRAVDSVSRRVLLEVTKLDGRPLDGALTQSALDMIRGDRKDGAPDLNAGNYKTLRLWVHTTTLTPDVFDAQVIGFDTAGRIGVVSDPLRPLPSLDESLEAGQPIKHIWVRWPEDIDLPAPFTDGAWVHLYAPGHEPTETYPLHVGVQDASHAYGAADGGIHPFDLLERLYTEAGIRIDPVAFAALKADTSYRRGAWRITAPQQLAEWAERHIYRNTLVVPFIDNQGRISPKSLLIPPGLNPDTLFVFDASNTKEPYPTFDHQDGETVNSVGVEYGEENPVESVDPSDHNTLDGISVEQRTREPIRHSTVVQGYAPERQITLDLSGWQDAPLPKNRPDPITGIYIPPIMGTRHLGMGFAHINVASSVLFRWGDGPITQVIYGTEATREVQAGDWVIVDQDSLHGPNPATNARSGKRLVQVLKPDILPIGYRFEVLDAGPLLPFLAAPSISVAQNPNDPKHSISVTVSDTPQDATVTVEVAYDSGFERIVHTLAGVGDGVHGLGPLASGTQVHVRAYSTAPGRIRSFSTATQTVTTQALSAPTNAAATASGRTIRLDWTPEEDGYALMPTLDGDDALPSPLPAGSTTYIFTGLEASTQYTVGVKHVDPYGGESAIASDTETTGASTQLAAPRRLWIRQGRTDPAQPSGGFLGELIARMRTGLEVQFVPGDPQASHRLQAASDASFNEIIIEVPIRPGVDRVRFPTALRADLVYVRIRAERDGYTESDWSEVVSAYPTVLQDETPDSDMLPGGWATARIDEAGKVWLDIGSDDPDTERAYYTINTTAYTEPNTGSTHVDRSAMPATIDTGLTLQYGQTAYIWVRFWKGGVFGQATRRAVTRTADALAPSIQADPVQSGSTGTLTLTINDPGRRVQEIQYQMRTGGGSFGGTWLNAWDSSTGTPGTDATLIRTKSVTLVKGHSSEIKWRIAWTDGAGNVRVVIDSHTFDSDTVADVQGVQVSFNGSNQVVVSATGDEDTVALYVTAAVGSDPADPTTSSTSIAARHGTVTLTSVTVAPGQVAHVKVRGRNTANQLGPVRLVRVPNGAPDVVGAADVLVVMPRWVYSGADAHLELAITYGSLWRSLRVEYQYSSVPGGPPDTTANYVFDLQAGGGNALHLVEDADGLVRFWSPEDPPPTITVTPYKGPGGTGDAGTPQFVQPEDLAQSGAVGGRVGTTDDPTVYQADRILFQHPTSLGFQITTVGGVPVVQLDGIASVQQGGTGLSSSPGKGGLLVGDGEGGYALLSRGSSGSVLQVAGDVVGWGPVPSHTHTFGDITGQATPSQLGLTTPGAIVKRHFDPGVDEFLTVTGQPGQVLTWDENNGWTPGDLPPSLPPATEQFRFLQVFGSTTKVWGQSEWGLPSGPPPERRYLYHPGGTEGTAAWGLPTWNELQNKPSVAITTQDHTISGLWTFRRGAAYPSLILGRDGFDNWGIGPSTSGGVQRFTIRDEDTSAAWSFYVTGRIDGPGDGNVGIGGDAVSTYMLSVVGSVRATGGFFDTSDVRLKKDIEPLDGAADPRALLIALEPVRFRWKETGEPDIGLVAQQTPEPFLGPDGLTIAYHRITTTLVAGWQDHERRLRALELALKEASRGLA